MSTLVWKKSGRCAGNGSCVEAAGAEFRKTARSFASGNCVEAAGASFASASLSASNGHCVEASSASFRASAASIGNGNCVETGHEDGVIFLRDSKDAGRDFPHLHYPVSEWDGGRVVYFAPVSTRKVPGRIRAVALERGHEPGASWYVVTRYGEYTALFFDQAERDAFEAGVADGEFELETAVA